MSILPNKKQNLSEKTEVALFTWTSRRMLFKEEYNLLPQILPTAHFKPIAEAVIGPVVTLDVNSTTSKEVLQLIEQYSIFRSQFKTEAKFDFRSTALGLIEVNGETSFAIHQTQHIISGQH